MKFTRLLLVTCCLAMLPLSGLAVQPSRLLAQLADPHTTEAAEQQLEVTGSKDQNVSSLVSKQLPSLIEHAVSLPVLYQMANLAGKLRVQSTVPALCKRLEQNNLIFMSQTFYQSSRLQNDPIAHALVAIGNPSVDLLAKTLRSPIGQTRYRAAQALKLLATPDAEAAIQAYKLDGKDPHILVLFQ